MYFNLKRKLEANESIDNRKIHVKHLCQKCLKVGDCTMYTELSLSGHRRF